MATKSPTNNNNTDKLVASPSNKRLRNPRRRWNFAVSVVLCKHKQIFVNFLPADKF